MQYRNSQKRDFTDNNVYFIVTKTYNNFPYFKESIFCELFIKDLKICKELKRFKLYGFCMIYDHLNLLIHPNNEFNISKIMQNIKRTVSLHINQTMSGNLSEGDNIYCRLQRDLLIKMHSQFIQKYGKSQTKIPKFKWQKSYYDHMIRNSNDFVNHYNYTVYNFQKHDLSRNWKYTSLNYGEMINEIEL